MLKAIVNLFETNKKVIGNHSRDGWNDATGHVSRFKYHNNVICIIEWNNRTCILTNCGWNTPSTNRALNDYKRYVSTHFPDMEIIDMREL